MTEAERWCLYRVVPKWRLLDHWTNSCSLDHGEFFDGDIHDSNRDAQMGANDASQPLINETTWKTTIPFRVHLRANPYTRRSQLFL